MKNINFQYNSSCKLFIDDIPGQIYICVADRNYCTGWPGEHGRVFMVLCKKVTCTLYSARFCTLCCRSHFLQGAIKKRPCLTGPPVEAGIAPPPPSLGTEEQLSQLTINIGLVWKCPDLQTERCWQANSGKKNHNFDCSSLCTK